jgi:hypothetical protein
VTATTAAVEAVWRIESGRLVAALARTTGDFAAAEDLAQDALEIALKQWPREGVPDHPASWLMATVNPLASRPPGCRRHPASLLLQARSYDLRPRPLSVPGHARANRTILRPERHRAGGNGDGCRKLAAKPWP